MTVHLGFENAATGDIDGTVPESRPYDGPVPRVGDYVQFATGRFRVVEVTWDGFEGDWNPLVPQVWLTVERVPERGSE